MHFTKSFQRDRGSYEPLQISIHPVPKNTTISVAFKISILTEEKGIIQITRILFLLFLLIHIF